MCKSTKQEESVMEKKVNYRTLIDQFWLELEVRSKGKKAGGGRFMVIRRLFGTFLIGMN